MITLVKHHYTTAQSKAVTESFDSMDKALVKFYQYMSNYAADETVVRADVVLLNDSLIPCKTEHFIREIPQEEPTEEQDETITEPTEDEVR